MRVVRPQRTSSLASRIPAAPPRTQTFARACAFCTGVTRRHHPPTLAFLLTHAPFPASPGGRRAPGAAACAQAGVRVQPREAAAAAAAAGPASMAVSPAAPAAAPGAPAALRRRPEAPEGARRHPQRARAGAPAAPRPRSIAGRPLSARLDTKLDLAPTALSLSVSVCADGCSGRCPTLPARSPSHPDRRCRSRTRTC